ncbi:MAG: twin-arginine translocation signal domain-containing protein, partial [Pseudomonadota bacterium]
MRDFDRKQYMARTVDRYVRGQISRRDFLRTSGQLGLGAGALGLGMTRPFFPTPALAADDGLRPSEDVLKWVKEVSAPFRGTTLKLATESTPPSNAINSQLKPFFEEASGMTV